MSWKPNPQARHNDLVMERVDEETLVFDLTTNEAHCLNRTCALVFELSDGSHDVGEIARLVGHEIVGVSEDVVLLALESLGDKGLLENASEIETGFAGLSRREALRRIGLASALAAPVVASIVAPQAAQAGSICVPDCVDRACGSDGCVGSCGSCGPGLVCTPDGQCVAEPP